MTKTDVKYFTHQLLPFFTPHNLSLSNLTKPRSFGGFGLIDPYEQLKGRQAKFIFHILINSENPHYVLFRHKLQMFTNMTCHGFCYSTEQNIVRTVPWYTALLGYKDPLTNAVTRLDSDITNHLVFKSDICQVLSDLDRTYLDSWFDDIHYQVKHYETTHIPHNYSLRDYQQMVSSICPNTENIIELHPTLFKSRSKKIQHQYWTKHTSRLIPETISNLTNSRLSDWHPFWSFLKSHFLSTKIHTDHIQLFHLGIGLWKFYQEQRCTFCSTSLADIQPNVSSTIQPSFYLHRRFLA